VGPPFPFYPPLWVESDLFPEIRIEEETFDPGDQAALDKYYHLLGQAIPYYGSVEAV